jgi:hypothetical protein
MFGFGKKKEADNGQHPEKTKKSRVDKLVMGAIIGVAVGSVVGMTIAPQKGSETRRMIADKGMEAINKGKEIGIRIAEDRKVRKGFLRRLLGLIFGGGRKKKPDPLRKIPREQPAVNNKM